MKFQVRFMTALTHNADARFLRPDLECADTDEAILKAVKEMAPKQHRKLAKLTRANGVILVEFGYKGIFELKAVGQ